jgi:hypothetical protein
LDSWECQPAYNVRGGSGMLTGKYVTPRGAVKGPSSVTLNIRVEEFAEKRFYSSF